MRYRGKVTATRLDKGFCFVMTEQRREYFAHFSRIVNAVELKINNEVEFAVGVDSKGRQQAIEIVLVRPVPTTTAQALAETPAGTNVKPQGHQNGNQPSNL